jgi:hypothetical protein
MYDRRCDKCEGTVTDCYEPMAAPDPECPVCGGTVRRVWLPVDQGGKSHGVIPDGIPGGYWVKHGICNPDGSPRRFDSKSDMARAAEKAGLINRVVHEGSAGSDKSRNTVRWV